MKTNAHLQIVYCGWGHAPAGVAAGLAALVGLVALAGTAAAQPPTTVAVGEVVVEDIPPSIRLVGTVLPQRAAVIAAEVEGLIQTFAAEEGQFLKAGEVICRLDPAVAKLRVAEAEATLAAFEAELAELEAGERPETIRRLEALVEESEAIVEKWEYERSRVQTLAERGQSSAKERHDTEMDYIAAVQRLSQARAQLELARNGPRAEEILQARQRVAAQRAVVARLTRDLEKTEIRAPFTGAIVAKRTEVGEWIEIGGAVAEMVAIETVKVRLDVPEKAIPFAQAGQPATVEVEAFGTSRAAAISRVIPRATPAARTFPVEIDLENERHQLLPGMFVWALVPSGPLAERLMVPKDALVARGTGKTLFVLRPGPDEHPLAVPVPVTTGLERGGRIEVEADELAAGDRVVTRANERLHGPTPVVVQELPGAPATADERGESSEPFRNGERV